MIGDIPAEVLTQGLTLANSLQNEFFFDRLPETDAAQFRMLSFTEVYVPDILAKITSVRFTVVQNRINQ